MRRRLRQPDVYIPSVMVVEGDALLRSSICHFLECTGLTVLRVKLLAAGRGLAGAWKPPPLKPRADALVGISAVVASVLAAMSIKIEERFNMVILLGLTAASK